MVLNTVNIGDLLITAFKNKYRYSGSSKGDLTTEEIFSLKKEQLNDIANDIFHKINNDKKDFIGAKSTGDVENENKLEIVKYAIALALEKEENTNNNNAFKRDLAKVERALENISNSKIDGMTEEELLKMHDELKSKIK